MKLKSLDGERQKSSCLTAIVREVNLAVLALDLDLRTLKNVLWYV